MKVLTTFGALMMIAIGAQAAIPIIPIILPPPNVSGTWTITLGSGNSNAPSVYTGALEQSGTSLTGFGSFASSGSPCANQVYITGSVAFGGSITLNVAVNGQTQTLSGSVASGAMTANGNYTSASGGCLAGAASTWNAVRAQQVLPQFAFGGGWYSALYFTNEGSDAAAFVVNFVDDTGNPLTVPAVSGTSTVVSIPSNGSAIVEAPNVGSLVQGSAFMVLPGGVTGYGVFRQSVPGISDQEAVVPLSNAATTTSRMIWDDTASTTSFAVINTSSIAITVQIAVQDSNGTSLGSSSLSLGPLAKYAGTLRALQGISSVAGNRGTADFTQGTGIVILLGEGTPHVATSPQPQIAAQGTLSLLGLRFHGSAFTSIPTTDRIVLPLD